MLVGMAKPLAQYLCFTLGVLFTGLFLMWVFGDRLDFAFDSFWTGLAGFLILPWTSVCYAVAYAPIAGVSGIG